MKPSNLNCRSAPRTIIIVTASCRCQGASRTLAQLATAEAMARERT